MDARILIARMILALGLAMLIGIAGHYRIIGRRNFAHSGKKFRVYSTGVRINHWVAAISGTLFTVTGLVMLLSSAFDGERGVAFGVIAHLSWRVHAAAAAVFILPALIMLVNWGSQMLPRRYDIGWLKTAGGYLLRRRTTVKAGKFNAGQKAWFWLATLGGALMALSGIVMFFDVGGIGFQHVVARIHELAGGAVFAMFTVHVYMSVIAIKGSLSSMVSGEKSEDELATMHRIYYDELEKS